MFEIIIFFASSMPFVLYLHL